MHAKDFVRHESSGTNRHWLTRARKNAKWRTVKRRGPGDVPADMLDRAQYQRDEIITIYHERLELEREEASSRTPAGVEQELWVIALAYNLVRLEMRAPPRSPRSHPCE